MIAATWGRVPNENKVLTFTAALVAACMGFAYYGGILSHAPTLTRTVHVGTRLSAATAAAVVAAWGRPDQQLDGATVNANLAGTTCDIWQSKRAVLCYAP